MKIPKILQKVKDPICGMTVDPRTATLRILYEEKYYYFCSENCRSKFKTQLEQSTVQKSGGGCKCCP